jgi:hypothetical protein
VNLLLADIDVAAKAGRYVIYVLAVFGGFLVGNVLTLILCRLLAKAMFKRRMPEQLERALRVIGGIVVAALVAFLLFRMGPGWGLGGSGTGEGEGSGGPSKESKQGPGKDTTTTTTPNVETVQASRLRLTIQRAPAYPQTFRFEGEPEAVDLATAKEKLRKRAADSKGKLQLVEIAVYQDSTEVGHADVRGFIDFANEIGIATRVDKVNARLE